LKQHTARKKGFEGEKLAEQFLEKHSYTIVQKNFICRGGEIDIVAVSPDSHIVFVEVKHYSANNWCHPLEAITKQKQKRLIKAAKYFLLTQSSFTRQSRFDAIIITQDNTIEHYKNIFLTT